MSYSCTTNIGTIISAHNQKILKSTEDSREEHSCNCQKECILPNNCRAKCVVYRATTQKTGHRVEYIGSTGSDFKVRYRNHKNSFRKEHKMNQTALSSYIWNHGLNKNENDEVIDPEITWEILKKCNIQKPGHPSCDLCISEKLFITKNIKNPKNINHRSDLGNKCAHRGLNMLSAVT